MNTDLSRLQIKPSSSGAKQLECYTWKIIISWNIRSSQLVLYTENLFHLLTQLVEDRDNCVGERLQQLIILRSPDVLTIAREPESDAAAKELKKLLMLMLRCAVQCKNKEYFLEEIKQMHVVVREVLEEDIRFITDNEDCNIVAFKDVAESTIDQLIYTDNILCHLKKLLAERDNCIEMISYLSHERDFLLSDKESENRRPLCHLASPAVSPKKVAHANKEKIKLLTEEIEEKNVALEQLMDELLESRRQQNRTLSQHALQVRAYRDEIDELKSKTDRVDKLDGENLRLKENLRDLDHYKKMAKELREQNFVLEEQVRTGLNSREERIEILEEENKNLKWDIAAKDRRVQNLEKRIEDLLSQQRISEEHLEIRSPSPATALPEFQCQVCDRIFNTIQGRSAHMKNHQPQKR
ncbi:positive regulation of protein localization to cilium [Porites harrisoni]